jgi:pimeloyl-ACP methyl ester carboxylesterase
MAYVTAQDGTRLWMEEAGTGSAILFIHEFGGDHRSWEPQMRAFARRHRCITYAARGYPPSDVPADAAAYGQDYAITDALAVLDALGLARAHIVGLSMGGFAALHLGRLHPDRTLSVTAAGAGYGAEKQHEAYFRDVSLAVAQNFEQQGAPAFARIYALGASRVQFQNKDPRGWEEFARRLGEHSSLGAANTMRGFQARRPSLYDFEAEFRAMDVPVLVVNGDEDDHCLMPGLFLKRTIPRCGLAVLPKTGHTLNLEEPELFNRLLAGFIATVEAGRWDRRDPRAAPAEVLKTS